jgi:hypothetical protein
MIGIEQLRRFSISPNRWGVEMGKVHSCTLQVMHTDKFPHDSRLHSYTFNEWLGMNRDAMRYLGAYF